MKDDPRPVHEHEHAEPTVIQHPDEEMTILARWLQHAMEQGARFWLLVGGAAVALLAVAALLGSLAAGQSSTNRAWIDLVPAKSAEEQLRVAEAHPHTPLADWARLQAAFEEYRYGLDDLITPGRRETSGPRLTKALELFRQVAKDAAPDSPQARGAALGIARTLEARNELPQAIEQYRKVAETWKGTPEARQSEDLAKALQDPENVQFYKELYAYKPPAKAAGAGSTIPDIPPSRLPGMNFDLGRPGGPTGKSFLPDIKDLMDLAPPPPSAMPAPGPATPSPAEPPKAEAPKVDPPKAEPPKVDELPAEPTRPK